MAITEDAVVVQPTMMVMVRLEANNNKGAETTTMEIAGTTVVGDN